MEKAEVIITGRREIIVHPIVIMELLGQLTEVITEAVVGPEVVAAVIDMNEAETDDPEEGDTEELE